ncbi:hypothetical protein GGQ97_000022 [Sphingomonas kaistensis]|uniref:Glycerophosphoryl diester phosphodiesterase membrane domain-containing protein n=1 Tax=Sphingomonas kaistensis TaxID=298708 RepID=A0A7X5Y2Y7_9SPHN|nr:hypothetical protein [Sphingomonas kaistensis]NJC04229.1 hypothetical protein [Sphingomonas kaistensis]
MKLSIGQAWDEARGVFRADGKAIFAVALALTVLPGAILETIAPSNLRTNETPWWIALLGLVAALLSLTSQIAISRIALGPSTTVGGALALAFRRMPALFGALLLAILPFALVLTTIGMTQGTDLTPATVPPAMAGAVLLIMLVGLFVLIRLLFLTPLSAERREGPIALLRSAWQLSRGHFLKLLGVILLLLLVALLLVGALGGAVSAVAILALGPIAPGNLSALLVALVQQGLAAMVSVLFVVVVCRLYAQAAGEGFVRSVPDAGRD